MEVMEPENHAEAVANGAQFLDGKFPGWYQLIDKDRLDLQSCDACVAGQLGRQLGKSALTPEMRDFSPFLGFDSILVNSEIDDEDELTDESMEESYRELDREWLKAIDARLKADELPPCPVCGSAEPDCELDCSAVPPRMTSNTQTTKEAIRA